MVDVAFLEEIAREAGAILTRHHGALSSVEKKGARDLVTVADRESEEHLIRRITGRYPDHSILAEESASDVAPARELWILDPLDGTTNFVHGIPHYAVSVAFYADGQPAAACVHNPRLDECYLAQAGAGATRNGAPIRVSDTGEIGEALLATGFHYYLEGKADSNLQHFVDFSHRARGIRRLGSAALDLCYLAAGHFDGFWELHLSPWDVAGGALIAREAGATVTDFAGGARWLRGGEIVAANPRLHPEILRILAEADPDLLPGPGHPA